MAARNLHREMHKEGLLVVRAEDVLLYGKMKKIPQLWSVRKDRSVMGPWNCWWLLVGIREFCVVLGWWIPRGRICAVQLKVL